mgnify:CR=1 FL=1
MMSDYHEPVNIGNPTEMSILEFADVVNELDFVDQLETYEDHLDVFLTPEGGDVPALVRARELSERDGPEAALSRTDDIVALGRRFTEVIRHLDDEPAPWIAAQLDRIVAEGQVELFFPGRAKRIDFLNNIILERGCEDDKRCRFHAEVHFVIIANMGK